MNRTRWRFLTLTLALSLAVLPPVSWQVSGAGSTRADLQRNRTQASTSGARYGVMRGLLEQTGTLAPMVTRTATATATGTPAATDTATVIVAPEQTLTETPVGTSTVTPGATPTESPVVEVSVISVRIEKDRAKPDWELSHPSLKRAQAGSLLTLSIYYTVAAASKGDPVTAQWTVTKGRHTVLKRKLTHGLGSCGRTQVAPTLDLYRDHIRFKLGKAGKYVYTGRVTVKRISDAGRTSITAVRRKR